MRASIFILLFFVLIAPTWAAQEVYICPMHPYITGEKGETCPICGMELVPREGGSAESGSGHEGHEGVPLMSTPQDQNGAFLHIDPFYVQKLGVRMGIVGHHDFGRDIRAFGRVMPSTRREHAIDVRTRGWIVDLETDAVGDTVKKGDLLFTYYSPDLMTAQSDFLIGGRIGNAEQRLRLYGMGEKAIALLKKEKKMLEKTPFYAPVDGTVNILNVRAGAHVNEGAQILMLQDYTELWVNVDVPLRDLEFLEIGTPARVFLPETGRALETKIDFIHPVNNPQTRTGQVRLLLQNPEGLLKTETYVDVIFDAQSRSRLAVPAEAVLYGGMGASVMEDAGDGRFRPVMVTTGITSRGLTEITSGLTEGQHIVTSGQFMLDAESSLRGGMAAMGHNHE